MSTLISLIYMCIVWISVQGSSIGEKRASIEGWKWSRPDANTYAVLIQGLASSLRVSDALKIIASACRVGVSPSEEVHIYILFTSAYLS